ncbi:MAG: hypothetical protein IJW70_06350 [Clostridia bacterium]|nr:hypothetical protein [Clostridia bacterium]
MKNVNDFGGFCNEFGHQKRARKNFFFFSKNRNFFAKKCVYIGEGAVEVQQKRMLNACKSATLDKIHLVCYNEEKQTVKFAQKANKFHQRVRGSRVTGDGALLRRATPEHDTKTATAV